MEVIKQALRQRDLDQAASWAKFHTLLLIAGWGVYFLIAVDVEASPSFSAFIRVGDRAPAIAMIVGGLLARALIRAEQWRLVAVYLLCAVLMGSLFGLFLAGTWQTTAVWTYGALTVFFLRGAFMLASMPFAREVAS